MGDFQVKGQGLLAKLIDGEISAENDLILIQKNTSSGRVWQLLEAKQNPEISKTAHSIISGTELISLFKAIANNDEKSIPLKFQGDDYSNLTKNGKFRIISRLIPGMETNEHKLMREKISNVKRSILEVGSTVGKGLSKIEKQGYSGRFVGQDQGEHPYWLRELIFKGAVAGEVNIIFNGWKEDKATKLSIKEWTASKQNEWQASKSTLEFLPWLSKQIWDNKEKAAWQEAHPNVQFSQQSFDDWQKDQQDLTLILPTWLLKQISEKTTDKEFAKWRDETILGRKKNWETFKSETGLDISFEDHEKKAFEHSNSGSLLDSWQWILNDAWKNSGTIDTYPVFVRKLKWTEETDSGKTSLGFDEWNKKQDDSVIERFKGSSLPLTFEEWKAQQDDSILNDPAPFILLDEKSREIYRTICDSGMLTRNLKTLDTSFDKTLHSGNGYAIFVIGPDQDLYTGSHIGGVFHHSSFLGEGAVMAAGEIKTNKNGQITELSSKSGHYRPTDKENQFMLNYFKNRGADLSKLQFTAYGTNGQTEKYNAAKYLNYLEHKHEYESLNKKIKNSENHISKLKKQRSESKKGKTGRAKKSTLTQQLDIHEKNLKELTVMAKALAPR